MNTLQEQEELLSVDPFLQPQLLMILFPPPLFFFKSVSLSVCLSACLPACLSQYVHTNAGACRPGKSPLPGSGVSGGFKLLDVGAGIQLRPSERAIHCPPLSYLSLSPFQGGGNIIIQSSCYQVCPPTVFHPIPPPPSPRGSPPTPCSQASPLFGASRASSLSRVRHIFSH